MPVQRKVIFEITIGDDQNLIVDYTFHPPLEGKDDFEKLSETERLAHFMATRVSNHVNAALTMDVQRAQQEGIIKDFTTHEEN